MTNKHTHVFINIDLSAAFYTVDHNTLLTRLSDNVGLSGVPVTWFASYLGGRTQAVRRLGLP